jgi:hypothetical protein
MTRPVVVRSIAVTLAGGAVVTTVAATTMGLVGQFVAADLMLADVAVLAMATVGTLLAIRIAGNAIGWLLLVAALCLGIENFGLSYMNLSLKVATGTLPGTAAAAWLSVLFGLGLAAILTIPLVYPDGRLLSRRWRWVVAGLVYALATSFAHAAFRPGPMPYTDLENPFGSADIERFLPPADVIGVFAAVIYTGAIASVVIRYRRAGVLERLQLKWLIAVVALLVTAQALVVAFGSLGLTELETIGFYMGLLSFALLPVAIGIAVLRYRLYEIDRIISRTLSWTVVTGVLVTVFVAVVVALQGLLAGFTQGQTLAVAGSTIVVFALFQPLRRRIQQAIDRRFDRSRYDADRVVAGLGVRLSHVVDLDALLGEIGSVAGETVRPTSSAVWLRRSGP